MAKKDKSGPVSDAEPPATAPPQPPVEPAESGKKAKWWKKDESATTVGATVTAPTVPADAADTKENEKPEPKKKWWQKKDEAGTEEVELTGNILPAPAGAAPGGKAANPADPPLKPESKQAEPGQNMQPQQQIIMMQMPMQYQQQMMNNQSNGGMSVGSIKTLLLIGGVIMLISVFLSYLGLLVSSIMAGVVIYAHSQNKVAPKSTAIVGKLCTVYIVLAILTFVMYCCCLAFYYFFYVFFVLLILMYFSMFVLSFVNGIMCFVAYSNLGKATAPAAGFQMEYENGPDDSGPNRV